MYLAGDIEGKGGTGNGKQHPRKPCHVRSRREVLHLLCLDWSGDREVQREIRVVVRPSSVYGFSPDLQSDPLFGSRFVKDWNLFCSKV